MSIPGVAEYGSFLYAINKITICNFVENVTYITLMSVNIQFRIKCNIHNADESKYISHISAIYVYD